MKKPSAAIKVGVILAFIVYGFSSIFIVPLIWTIPGFISGNRLLKGNQNSQVTSGVLALLFAGILPGILILVGHFGKK